MSGGEPNVFETMKERESVSDRLVGLILLVSVQGQLSAQPYTAMLCSFLLTPSFLGNWQFVVL